MDVIFKLLIEINDIEYDVFDVNGEWTLPCLPREGEKINTLIVLNQCGFNFGIFKNAWLNLCSEGVFNEKWSEDYKNILQNKYDKEKEKTIVCDILDDWLLNIVKKIRYIPSGKDGTNIRPIITIK